MTSERLQKPFLTVETGEAYQPIRLSYKIRDNDKLQQQLNSIKCLEKSPSQLSWNWFWRDECRDLHFESIDSFKLNPKQPLRLGTLSIRQNSLYIHLPSFKRACLAVPLFHRFIPVAAANILYADFINKVFGTDEPMPRNLVELFDDKELQKLIDQRIKEYEKIQAKCESASTPEEAFSLLAAYTKEESRKRLPYVERYEFQPATISQEPDAIYLGFYIFLRSRELVAIRRWFGDTQYSLADAAEESVQQVFGDMDIDIIE